MCKKFFQSLLGGGAKAPKPPATQRTGGDEGGEALVLASDVVEAAGATDPNGGRVKLSGSGSRRGDRIAGLSI